MVEAQRDRNQTSQWFGGAPTVAALLPLVTWPGLAEPFSTPKRWLLTGAVAVLLPVVLWRRAHQSGSASLQPGVGGWSVSPALQALMVLWLASFAWSALAAPAVAPDALLLGIAGPLWCLLIAVTAVPFTAMAAAHVGGATVVACIAFAQAMGLDAFAWSGWVPGIEGASVRMRVYGTLGNPDFVAAMMAITIPLACGLVATPAASRTMRAVAALAIVALTAALVATGSRAGAIGLACGVIVFATYLRHRRSRWVIAGAVLAAVVAVAVSDGRGAVETLRGRVYVWQTAWAHAWDEPVTGFGPGAFELQYAGWNRAALMAGKPGAREFAGPQQAAHNDMLEALIERGVGGLVTMVLVCATPLFVWRRVRGITAGGRAALAGAAGAIVACAAVSCLDFPLQRPAETAALWMAVGLAWQASSGRIGGHAVRSLRTGNNTEE